MDDINDRVLDIQRSHSNELRNRLLSDLKDEVYKIAKIHCNKIGREPTNEEFSIALHTMNEAIDHFDQNKNKSFGAFVRKMICYRLIDFFRKEKQREFVLYDNPNIALLSHRTSNVDKEYTENLRDELVRFSQLIGNIGYKWADIRRNRPKHRDTLGQLLNIAIYIVKLGLGEQFIKENPISRRLRKMIGVDRRTLKRYRPYLCSIIIVYIYDFPIIRHHIETLRREVHNGTSPRSSR